MNRHFDGQEPAQLDDEVARFFAEQREQVQPAPSSDLDWQRIVHTATRRSPRRRNFALILASAAAAAAAVFGVWSWQQQPMTPSDVRAGQSVQSVQGMSGTVQNSGEVESRAQSPTAVPSSYLTWSVSNAGNGTIYALGSSTCVADICPTLVRSSDSGHTWQAVHQFSTTDTSYSTGADVPEIQPDRAVSEVRFASTQVGYVFGSSLWVTYDGGASFRALTHPGQAVLDVEISQGKVMIASADGCYQGSCSGPIYLSTTSPTSTKVTQVAKYTPSQNVGAVHLAVQDGVTMLQMTGTSGAAIQPLQLRGDSLVPLSTPGCGNQPLQALALASTAKRTAVGLCEVRRDQSSTTFSVVRSTDGGATWAVVGVRSVKVPSIGRLSISTTDGQAIVVATGGPRSGSDTGADATGSLLVSNDGGRTFAAPQTQDHLPTSGFDWVGSPGARQCYAVPRITGGFWQSTDNGSSWKVVTLTS